MGPASRVQDRVRLAGALALALLVVVAAGLPAAARADAAGAPLVGRSVALLPPRVDDEVASLGPGLAIWMTERLRAAGIQVAEPAQVSAALEERRAAGASRSELPGAVARAVSTTHAVSVDLRVSAGVARLHVRLRAAGAAQLVRSDTRSGPLGDLGAMVVDSTAALVAALGRPAETVRQAAAPRLADLVSFTRSAAALERGQLARAWRELEGKVSPAAESLRASIDAAARRNDTPGPERARVLIAQGTLDGGWMLVRRELASTRDATTLIAGGEGALVRNSARQAVELFTRAAAADPRRIEAQRGLGEAFAVLEDFPSARRAFERALALDPWDPAPLEKMATFGDATAQARARLLLEAGKRASQALDPEHAHAQLARATALDAELTAEARILAGELQLRLGDPRGALAALEQAIRLGCSDVAAAWRLAARAKHLLGDLAGAEAGYREALELRADDALALRGLGEVLLDAERDADAVAQLERAVELAPADAEARRALARALQRSGDPQRALTILPAAEGSAAVEDLLEIASIHTSRGDHAAARVSLERAVELAPDDPDAHHALARVLQLEGDAARADSERALAELLAGSAPQDEPTAPRTGKDVREGIFDSLAASYPARNPVTRERILRVMVLGLNESKAWREYLRDFTSPRRPELARLERELLDGFAKRYEMVPSSEIPAELRPAVDALLRFDGSPEKIALVNDVLGVDAVVVARLLRAAGSPPPPPEIPQAARLGCELETRLLVGRRTDGVSILTNSAKLAKGVSGFESWNLRAFLLYAIGIVLGLAPLLRGWGTLIVHIKYSTQGKGFFSIRISRRGEKASRGESDGDSDPARRFERRLRWFSRYEQHMAGPETRFSWLPARSYHVAVHGLLRDPVTEQVVGNYFEEKRVHVARGRLARLDFDFRPKETPVEILVVRGTQPVRQATASVPGTSVVMRYVREGSTLVYLPQGRHRVVVGFEDCVFEREVTIDSASPTSVIFDVGSEDDMLFQGCPEAIEPCLHNDLLAAAKALEAVGQVESAHRLRAEFHRARGDTQTAAAHFEMAGRLLLAAEMFAAAGEFLRAAALFEQAGDFTRAGDAHRSAGDVARAAHAYESAYAYEKAIECYRELGDFAKAVELLERTGSYYEAGRLANEQGDIDAAIRNLQQVEVRNNDYVAACRILSTLFSERGEPELALQKLDEVIAASGGDHASVSLLEERARLLEQVGSLEQALEAYEVIRRRDFHHSGAATRIEELRKRVSQERIPGNESAGAGDGTSALERRYEILGEVGRGGMGVVYKARDRRLGRIVALKRLPENLRDQPLAVQFFLREARAAAALNHPNIVTLFDADESDGTYFITMELLEGAPLQRILRDRGRLSPRDVARIGAQIAGGLQYAHERRIVHRDIKTANLFFTREKVVKIMDFGLAKMLEEVRKQQTVIAGTPYYMAPEQAAGETVDHRADLYAFGVTLFELVTGTLPFTAGEVTYHHRYTPAPDPRSRVEGIPQELAELILELMAKSPDERPSTAASVGMRLQTLAKSLPR